MSVTKTDSTHIRHMTPDDIDAVLSLINKTTDETSRVTRKDLSAYHPGERFDLSFVAEAGQRIVGFVMANLQYVYIPFVAVCLIHAVAVDPEFRRRGIGSALISELSILCHLQDINTIRALLRKDDARLQRFLEHLGFRPSSTVNWDKTFEAWPIDG